MKWRNRWSWLSEFFEGCGLGMESAPPRHQPRKPQSRRKPKVSGQPRADTLDRNMLLFSAATAAGLTWRTPAAVTLLSEQTTRFQSSLTDAAKLTPKATATGSGRRGTLRYYRRMVEALRAAGSGPLMEELDRVVSEMERVAGVQHPH